MDGNGKLDQPFDQTNRISFDLAISSLNLFHLDSVLIIKTKFWNFLNLKPSMFPSTAGSLDFLLHALQNRGKTKYVKTYWNKYVKTI